MSAYKMGIDFGTTRSAVAVMLPGHDPELVEFDPGDGGGPVPEMPSTVFREDDGEILAGFAAESSMMRALDQAERTPKAKLRGGHVVELLGQEPVPVIALVEAVLREAYRAGCERMGGEPDGVALTCPVAWAEGGKQWRALNAAAHLAGIEVTKIITEPAAAAHHVALTSVPLQDRQTCAVYDLGGGTFDVALMRRERGGLRPLAMMEEEIGGELFDERLYLELLAELEDRQPDVVRRLREVRDNPLTAGADVEAWYCHAYTAANVRRAKEELSRRDSCPVLVPAPADVEAVFTRGRFEELIGADLERCAQLLADCIGRGDSYDGDGSREPIAAVYLVGGASQIPAVVDHVAAAAGRAPTLADHPKGAIALGAVRTLVDRSSTTRLTPEPGSRRALAGDRRVHCDDVLDACRHGDSLLVLHGQSQARRVSRFNPLESRFIAEADLPDGHFMQLTCGASGLAVIGPQRLELLDHALIVRGRRTEPVFARIGDGVAWVGYLGEGQQERGVLKRAVRPLRVRTFLLGGDREGMVDDIHVGEVATGRTPKGLGGLEQLRPEPPAWTISDAGGDSVDELVLTLQRARKTRLGIAWSQDCVRLDRDGMATPEGEITERPWTIALLRRDGRSIRLSGREPERSAPAGSRRARAPGSLSVDGQAIRTYEDDRVEMALYAGTHDVFVLSQNYAPLSEGGGWWELHRCEPSQAVRVHRGETPNATWTGEDARGTWFCERVWEENSRSVGIHVLTDGSVRTIAFEPDARTLPLAEIDGRVYALVTPNDEPTSLVSYAWPG
jgi:Hsp70 protein